MVQSTSPGVVNNNPMVSVEYRYSSDENKQGLYCMPLVIIFIKCYFNLLFQSTLVYEGKQPSIFSK